jgi:hypothetical protein
MVQLGPHLVVQLGAHLGVQLGVHLVVHLAVHLAIQLMVHPGALNFQWWEVIACLLTDFLVEVVRLGGVVWVVGWVVVCMVEWGVIGCTTAC